MNKTMFLSFLLACSLGLASCNDTNAPIDHGSEVADRGNITVSEKAVNINPTGGEATIKVTTPTEWSASSSAKWLTVAPANGIDRKPTLTLKAEANTTTDLRSATVTVFSGSSRAYISVTQAAGSEVDSLKCPIAGGYKLVFHDEFDKKGSLDAAHWTHEVKPAGWVNGELQEYVNGSIDGNRVTEVRDGKLCINLFKHNGKVYSGRVYGDVKTGFRYGYIEAKIKLPKGRGTWPAFWMMPVNFKSWPADGEIDIMEHVGFDENMIHSTIHCNKYNNTGSAIENGHRRVAGATDEFHVYAMEWTAEYMTFYVDGKELLTYKNDGTGNDAYPFTTAFYPIFNLAWGGAWGGQKGVDESVLPATMMVEYVRVYQK